MNNSKDKLQVNAKREFNPSKEGIQITKIAAFCFAIISCHATASGLQDYVFIEKSKHWQAILISFAIQSILFVLNLRLPGYIADIYKKTISSSRNNNTNFLEKVLNFLKNYIITIKTFTFLLIIILYFGMMGMSSWFSYVYFSNTIYKKTMYLDANIELDNNYRNYLNTAEKYSKEYLKYIELNILTELSEINSDLSVLEMTFEQSDSSNEITESEDLTKKYEQIYSEYSITELTQTLNETQNDLARINKAYDNRLPYYMTTEEQYRDAWNIRYYDEETFKEIEKKYETMFEEKTNYENQINDLTAKQNALSNLMNRKNLSHESTINKFYREMAETHPRNEVLTQYALELYNMTIELSNDNSFINGSENIIAKTQTIRNLINSYVEVKEIINNDIDNLSTSISIPDYSKDNHSEEVIEWKNTWSARYQALENIIKKLPAYQKNNYNVPDLSVNVQILQEFKPQDIIDNMVILQRKYLSGINEMEIAYNLLPSRFNALAIFSLIFAFFLDASSFLAGIFIYVVESSNR